MVIDHQQIAEALESARMRTATLDPISNTHPSFGVADAYEVGRRIATIREVTGSRACGFKIGFTYVPIWARIGVEAPFWAPIFHAEAQLDQPLAASEFTSPRLEPEVIVGIGTAIGEHAGVDEIASAVDWISLGFEVVDSHFPDWRATPPDLIADHGCHASIRLGARTDASRDALSALRDLSVELTCDSKVVEVGVAKNVLAGPIEAIAAVLQLPGAPRVEAGDMISTGSLTGRSHVIAPGQRWGIVPTQPGDHLRSLDLLVA